MSLQNKHNVILRGKRVILRPPSEKDIPSLIKGLNDPEIMRLTDNYTPATVEGGLAWLKDLPGRAKELAVFSVHTTDDGMFLGRVTCHSINWHNGTGEVGINLGEKKEWGKGYGTEAVQLLMQYAFEELGLRKLNASITEHNKRSLALFKKLGFTEEGRQKKQTRVDDIYYDEVLLGLFAVDYKPETAE